MSPKQELVEWVVGFGLLALFLCFCDYIKH